MSFLLNPTGSSCQTSASPQKSHAGCVLGFGDAVLFFFFAVGVCILSYVLIELRGVEMENCRSPVMEDLGSDALPAESGMQSDCAIGGTGSQVTEKAEDREPEAASAGLVAVARDFPLAGSVSSPEGVPGVKPVELENVLRTVMADFVKPLEIKLVSLEAQLKRLGKSVATLCTAVAQYNEQMEHLKQFVEETSALELEAVRLEMQTFLTNIYRISEKQDAVAAQMDEACRQQRDAMHHRVKYDGGARREMEDGEDAAKVGREAERELDKEARRKRKDMYGSSSRGKDKKSRHRGGITWYLK